jgi:hypothetical protein
MRRASLVGVFIVLAAGATGGCRRHRMSADDCRRVLDRIIEFELAERGFRDPVLAARRKTEMRALFAPDLLAGCEGRTVRAQALSCIERARSAEELSHRCLR